MYKKWVVNIMLNNSRTILGLLFTKNIKSSKKIKKVVDINIAGWYSNKVARLRETKQSRETLINSTLKTKQ